MVSLISAQDELLRLTGATNNPVASPALAGAGTPVYVGPDRSLTLYEMVGGTVTGAGATLDVKLQDSPDGLTGWADMGYAFPQQTASMATAIGNLADFPSLNVKMKSTRPYLRTFVTLAGTSPVFNGFAILHSPPVPW